MRPLQQRLAAAFTTVSVDWPGFGDRARPRVDWRPETYAAFLEHLLTQVIPKPFATVAAGHAASYALKQAATTPGSTGRLCLVAPTWRGPLPTMIGKHHPAFAWIARAVDQPFLGQVLYGLNVNRPVVRMMGRGHVYADPDWLNGSRLGEKLAVTRQRGLDMPRFASSLASSTPCEAAPNSWRWQSASQIRSWCSMGRERRRSRRPKWRHLPRGRTSALSYFPQASSRCTRSFLALLPTRLCLSSRQRGHHCFPGFGRAQRSHRRGDMEGAKAVAGQEVRGIARWYSADDHPAPSPFIT
jgi:pimeloyl-ACP methyl ester carboxylesterase